MEELPEKKPPLSVLSESMRSMDSRAQLLHNSGSTSLFDQTVIHWATLQVRKVQIHLVKLATLQEIGNQVDQYLKISVYKI